MQNIKKNRRRNPFEKLKKFGKSHSAKKIEKEDPLVSFGFVSYLKKMKEEKRPFALSLHWPDLALVVSGVSLKSGPISVSLKKRVTVIVGHFSLKGKRAD